MTWIKRLIFCALVFLGLYFFGDFRINDVNVRQQLRTWVPEETIFFWRDKAVDATQSAYQAVRNTLNADSPSSPEKIQQQNKPSDEISVEDAKKLKNLIQEINKP